MQRIDIIVLTLRKRGFRIGRGRRAVLEVLHSSRQPLTARETCSRLKDMQQPVDAATVYRELKFLTEEGVLHPVQFADGIRRFELAPAGGHRHHLVCTSCKSVLNVEMGCNALHALEKNIGKKNRFRMQGHALEFYGLCPRCA